MEKRDGNAESYNPFEEMMAIEAEYGNIFSEEENDNENQARANSRWYPFLLAVSQKSKHKDFTKVVEAAQERKDESLRQT